MPDRSLGTAGRGVALLALPILVLASACGTPPPPPLAAGTMGPLVTVAATLAPVTALRVSARGNRITVEWTAANDVTDHAVAISDDRGRHFTLRPRVSGGLSAAEAPAAVGTLVSGMRDAQLMSVATGEDSTLVGLWSSPHGRHLFALRHPATANVVHRVMAFDAPLFVSNDATPDAIAAIGALGHGAVAVWTRTGDAGTEIVSREIAFDALCAPVPATSTAATAPRPLVPPPGLPVLPPVVIR